MKLLIAAILLFSFTVQSALANDAITVKEGQVVTKPFDGGTLMDKEMAEKVRDELIEKDYLEKTNESLNKTIILHRSNEEILTNQKGILLNQNIELTKTLNDTRSVSGWEKVGYFVLGVVVTSAAVYGAARLAK
jgi:hypothetical protein